MAENILIVEDEALVRRELAQTLRKQGYEVTEAADGAEAVELLTKQHFNLIISDFVVPKLHGFNLVNLVQDKWPKMPVIVISGYLSESAGKTILEGLADFIQHHVLPPLRPCPARPPGSGSGMALHQ